MNATTTPIPICTRAATPFTIDGALDEDALRAHLGRLADAGVGFWLGSGGSGEGFTLSHAELARVYQIGVEVGRGRVLVGSNQPETHTPGAALEHAQIAVKAGVDVVNLYGPASWHGYRPTDREFLRYMDVVAGALDHELALSPNGTLGYAPSPKLLAQVTAKYPQVTTLNLTGINGDAYLRELVDELDREVVIYAGYPGSINALGLGATGLHDAVAEGNTIPLTFRRYADAVAIGDLGDAARAYRDLSNFAALVTPWKAASPRWLKMAMKVLGLPGGAGTVREPYLMPDAEDEKRFLEGALRLDIPEINDLARAAGRL